MSRFLRSFPAALLVASILLCPGCALVAPVSSAAPTGGVERGEAGTPRLQMAGKPLYELSLGSPAARSTAARPLPPFPPLTPSDEAAGRWLLLFELSYPAVESPLPTP